MHRGWLGLLTACGTAVASVASAEPPGWISGRVLDAAGAPIAGVLVQVFDSCGVVTSARSDAAGRYATPSLLETGEYFAATSIPASDPSAPPYLDQTYRALSCDPKFCRPADRGTPIAVTHGRETAGIDFNLVRGGRVSGHVQADVGGRGILATVNVMDVFGRVASVARTDVAGAYTTGKGLPAGGYTVAVAGNALGYVNELYDDLACIDCDGLTATPVNVSLGATTGYVDFGLQAGGSITGRVSSSSAASAVSSCYVEVYSARGRRVGEMNCLGGSYDTTPLAGLPAGDYYLKASMNERVTVLYGGVPCLPGRCDVRLGTPVHVNPYLRTAGIDFVLDRGGSVSGRITGLDGIPLPNARVAIYDGARYQLSGASTDSAGAYRATGLPPGDYQVSAETSEHVRTFYGAWPCPDWDCRVPASTVTVRAGSETRGIDLRLFRGARLSGRVTDALRGRPLRTGVSVVSDRASLVGYVVSCGNYVSTPMVAGKYFAQTLDTYRLGWRSQSYRDRDCGAFGDCFATGSTLIPVSTPLVPNIDFHLVHRRLRGDFDGDGRSDPTIFDPASGTWLSWSSSLGRVLATPFGDSSLVPVSGDFDGDGRADFAFYSPGTGEWLARDAYEGSVASSVLGGPGSVAAPADYDGDGKTDFATFKADGGQWTIRESASGAITTLVLGGPGQVPVPGEYDGDGRMDTAVYEPASGRWLIRESATGSVRTEVLGCPDCRPATGDYDDDGRLDVAVYQEATGTWTIKQSSDGLLVTRVFGSGAPLPVPADYDDDGYTDLAVYAPSTGRWTIRPWLGGPDVVRVPGAGGVPAF